MKIRKKGEQRKNSKIKLVGMFSVTIFSFILVQYYLQYKRLLLCVVLSVNTFFAACACVRVSERALCTVCEMIFLLNFIIRFLLNGYFESHVDYVVCESEHVVCNIGCCQTIYTTMERFPLSAVLYFPLINSNNNPCSRSCIFLLATQSRVPCNYREPSDLFSISSSFSLSLSRSNSRPMRIAVEHRQ